MKIINLLFIISAMLLSSCSGEESNNNLATQDENEGVILKHLADEDEVSNEIKASENRKKDFVSFGGKNLEGDLQWKFIDLKIATKTFYHDVYIWVTASDKYLTIIRDVWNSSNGIEYKIDEHDYRTKYKILSYNKTNGIHYYSLELLSGQHNHVVPRRVSIPKELRMEFIAISDEKGVLDHYSHCIKGSIDHCSLDRMLNYKNQARGRVFHTMAP